MVSKRKAAEKKCEKALQDMWDALDNLEKTTNAQIAELERCISDDKLDIPVISEKKVEDLKIPV